MNIQKLIKNILFVKFFVWYFNKKLAFHTKPGVI